MSLTPIGETGPAYTVVLPTLVDEPYIAEAVESVLAQSVPPADVRIMANGPKAGIEQIKVRLSARDSTISVHHVGELGMIPALCAGISQTRTPFIAFLDSDDLWLAGKQESQLQVLVENPELDAVYGLASNFRDVSCEVREKTSPVPAKMFTSTTFRHSVFTKFGLPDTNATHHTWLYRWWAQAGQLGINAELMAQEVPARRVHSRNSWITKSDHGRADLLSELRRQMQERKAQQS